MERPLHFDVWVGCGPAGPAGSLSEHFPSFSPAIFMLVVFVFFWPAGAAPEYGVCRIISKRRYAYNINNESIRQHLKKESPRESKSVWDEGQKRAESSSHLAVVEQVSRVESCCPCRSSAGPVWHVALRDKTIAASLSAGESWDVENVYA
jgi:hypothetical protein